jgi:hypothetical protein
MALEGEECFVLAGQPLRRREMPEGEGPEGGFVSERQKNGHQDPSKIE